jgi:hypothetical protein
MLVTEEREEGVGNPPSGRVFSLVLGAPL